MDNHTRSASKQLTTQEKMAQGSAWMTLGNIGSRLLGAIYILPWYYWMGANGDKANALFGMGYNVYALFLMISTAGIPAAIAKQISYYNSKEEYRTSQRLFFRALQLMAGFGVITAGIMYIAAPWLATASGGGEELIPTMRSLSVALLVFPCMSVMRGYFQGNQDMKPFAISQIIEQIARVFYMLLATFIIMRVVQGDYTAAVTQSTFAAFIGVLASVLVLVYYFQKQRVRMAVLLDMSKEETEIQTKELIFSTIKEAIPFIIVGSGITIFKLVDQYTFVRIMKGFTQYSNDQLLDMMAIFGSNPDKLTMVVIGLATSMASTGLPLISEAVAKKDQGNLAKLISNNLQLYSFVMLPATFGMIVLAYPLYTLFYRPDALGANVLVFACISGLVLGLFMLTSSMLQGMYHNKEAVIFFFIGLLLKFILQYPAIWLFQVYGPLVSTTLALGVTCWLNIRKMRSKGHFNAKLTIRRTVLILLMTLIMLIIALIARQLFGLVLSSDRKVQAFILSLLVAAVGGAAYIYMALKVRLAEKLLGSSMIRLRKKLRIK
ncbi:polysaccharide biosynthesis protein [Enterococcus sp.]|uniref:putative polysaccharide biosynthesis protein n=1 Tax=Enterococcus sp. TaxID=35783 RepID=UPI0025BE304D|nr:polysaccharide biosynthesis protein [Enterococcus sp.]